MKTNKDLIQTVNILSALIKNKETKVQKKLFKIFEKLKPHVDAYNEAREMLQLDHASVDSRDVLMLDEKGGFTYSRDGMKALTADIKKLLNTEIEFNVIEIVNPDGLNEYTFLNGWVSGVIFENDNTEL